MDKQSRTYQAYVQILKEELIPAMGCTEPIAIAYAAAKARDVLGGMPDKVEIRREQQHYQECQERHRAQHRWHEGH